MSEPWSPAKMDSMFLKLGDEQDQRLKDGAVARITLAIITGDSTLTYVNMRRGIPPEANPKAATTSGGPGSGDGNNGGNSSSNSNSSTATFRVAATATIACFAGTPPTTSSSQSSSIERATHHGAELLEQTQEIPHRAAQGTAEQHGTANGFSTPERRNLSVQQTEIPHRLKRMINLLVDEESSQDDDSGPTGVCMEYLLRNDILQSLVNYAEGDQPKGIMGETIRTIASMINLLDDRFLVHNAVHKPTVKLLRTCASGMEPRGEGYYEDLVDLMYIICSKIHGYPDLLNIFFHNKHWLTTPQRVSAKQLQKNKETMEMLKDLRQTVSAKAQEQSGVAEEADQKQGDKAVISSVSVDKGAPTAQTREDQAKAAKPSLPKTEYEFLLFTYLLRFVHLEGKAGDFARTGLLFLMELATGSLGEYILDADFTSYLAASVGALYSQLPRKLLVRGGPSVINGMVGTLNDRAPPAESTASTRKTNVELSTSTEFQSRLDAFLKLLEFCQDIMMRCPNRDIVATLLSSFKTIFLENILYPSILECSDTDGSSVAVISYIDLILQVLEHEALVDLVVGFLMSSDEDAVHRLDAQKNLGGDNSDNTNSAPQDPSVDDAFAQVQNPQTTSPYFMATGRFTLKDLILSRLKSRSQPTTIATLKLLNTVITRHCKYSLELLSIQADQHATSFREPLLEGKPENTPMISHHVHEMDLFYGLISTINPHHTAEVFCNGYESYLRDAEGSVEMHQCYLKSKEQDGTDKTPAQLSEIERKKQRRRSMKYGHRLDLPDNMSGDAFIQEQEMSQGAADKGQAPSKGPCCPVPMHRLVSTDPLLQTLLGTLSHFFAHSAELNLALTGVITSLSVCPYRSLEGWLLFQDSDVKSMEDGDAAELAKKLEACFSLGDSDDEDTMPACLNRDNSNSSNKKKSPLEDENVLQAFKSFPPFFTMLKTLTQQVDYYRSEIDDFDVYLADRRRTLLVATELNSAIHTPGLAGGRAPLSGAGAYRHVRNDPHEQYRQQNIRAEAQASRMVGVSSPAPQRINTNSLSPSSAQSRTPTGTPALAQSPRARKSSSPSNLMSTGSNMPFLVPPPRTSSMRAGVRGNGPVVNTGHINSNSNSPLMGPDSDLIGPSTPSTVSAGSMNSMNNSRMNSSTGSMTSSAETARPTMSGFGGMTSAYYAGTSTSSGNPMHKVMETMMIKPLFSDGFVNDSDSDVDETSKIDLSDEEEVEEVEEEGTKGVEEAAVVVEGEEAAKTSEVADATSPQSSGSKRVRRSTRSRESTGPGKMTGTHAEKKVTLGQLLTNVVILEEVVKEMVAMTQVRRGLGVDSVRYV
ncbi:hypothetical protein BGW38_001416 [Lunasporangiospora selenospora]|uniref:FHF complex subunit HOOK-interacting protein C-terminal domain-containing protein n=1 Tax=Lunasporangiospora selenospora TaxID=979761 RepID=A0A9P6FU38_9FUNG|nr:hypothetical protein BGW38_001416 [Lunasporangiospora selenospora]